jgi:hypothetical protein
MGGSSFFASMISRKMCMSGKRCDNYVFFGLILALLTYLYIHYFVAYISMFLFHQYQSEV